MSETRQFEPLLTVPVATESAVIEDVGEANSDQYDRRFQGTKTLYGQSSVDIFAASHVYIIGVGGSVLGQQKPWLERQ